MIFIRILKEYVEDPYKLQLTLKTSNTLFQIDINLDIAKRFSNLEKAINETNSMFSSYINSLYNSLNSTRDIKHHLN